MTTIAATDIFTLVRDAFSIIFLCALRVEPHSGALCGKYNTPSEYVNAASGAFVAQILATETTGLEADHRERHGAGIDRLIYALYGLTPPNQAGRGERVPASLLQRRKIKTVTCNPDSARGSLLPLSAATRSAGHGDDASSLYPSPRGCGPH